MTDIRRWRQIVENAECDQSQLKRDATVELDPSVGGGSGRYMHKTQSGAMIDVKGNPVEVSEEDFSAAILQGDMFDQGNEWTHSSAEQDTIGTSNERPEFDAGDLVEIKDVYGSTIGAGFGVFVAYGTTGQDCVINFDGKSITVPIENVCASVEQQAKDNFDDMDNDGNLSPMSLASDNVAVEVPYNGDGSMDSGDEFKNWIRSVEEALTSEPQEEKILEKEDESCGCEKWDCQVCFPDNKEELDEDALENDDGDDSPLTYGEDNLDEDFADYDEADIDSDDGWDDDIEFDTSDEFSEPQPNEYTDEIDSDEFDDEGEDERLSMISSILSMQDMGLSNASKRYHEDQLDFMRPEVLKKVYDHVTGDVAESFRHGNY